MSPMPIQLGPILVASTDAESAWLTAYFRSNGVAGWQETSRSRVTGERGHVFDRIDITATDGRLFTAWFEVTRF